MEVQHLSEVDAARASRAASSPLRACGGGGAPAAPAEGPDAHWAPESLPQLPAHASSLFGSSPVARCDYSSRLLTMRDGTRLALDVHLPCGAGGSARGGAPFDCVVVQSRYGRAWRLRWPYNGLWGGRPVDIVYFLFKSAWLAAGLAVVTLDVRGCGASFGTWHEPWSDAERDDSLEVLDWVAAQPWARGRKAALFGQSYDAVAALRTAAAKHPFVAAVVAVNPFLDMFADISAPGGVPQRRFAAQWGALIAAFDRQLLSAAPGTGLGMALTFRGVARALPDADVAAVGEAAADGGCLLGLRTAAPRRAARARRRALLAEAVAQHGANWDPVGDSEALRCADDVAPAVGKSPNDVSFARHLPELAAAGVPVYWTSAWFDATVAAATAGFAATRHVQGTQLLLGPWTHMLWQQVVPSGRGESRMSSFNMPRETLRWMLARLADDAPHGAPAASEPPASAPASASAAAAPDAELPSARVRYFEMGTGRWVHTADWPPPQLAAAYALRGGGLLVPLPAGAVAPSAEEAPAGRAAFRVRRDSAPTGFSRWDAMLTVGRMVSYDLRALPLRFEGGALAAPLRVAGSPVVTLYVDSSDGRGDLFAYLCDVHPSGKVHYVTEGCLRAEHRAERADAAVMAARLPQAAPPLPAHDFRGAHAAPLPPRPAPAVAAPPERCSFALMATAYVWPAGHRVALAIGGADPKHFAPDGEHLSRTLGVSWGPEAPSTLALPALQADE